MGSEMCIRDRCTGYGDYKSVSNMGRYSFSRNVFYSLQEKSFNRLAEQVGLANKSSRLKLLGDSGRFFACYLLEAVRKN